MKSNISTIKSGIEQFKLLYSEDLTKLGIFSAKLWTSVILNFVLPNICCLSSFWVVLGNHLRIVSHAASGYHKVVEENRKLYNQIQDLRGIASLHSLFLFLVHDSTQHSEKSFFFLSPGNIRVYCRVRPFHPGKVSSSSSVAGLEDRTITVMVPSKYGKDSRKSFTFNRVFGPLATQG